MARNQIFPMILFVPATSEGRQTVNRHTYHASVSRRGLPQCRKRSWTPETLVKLFGQWFFVVSLKCFVGGVALTTTYIFYICMHIIYIYIYVYYDYDVICVNM